mgnify:FL=1
MIFLTLLVAFFSWQSIDRAINVPEASNWGVPILLFSLLFVLFYLGTILIRRFLILQAMFLAALALSFVFSFSFGHLVISAIAYLLILWSLMKIKRDLHLNVKVSLWKSIGSGSLLMLFAVSLMISSQYYAEVKDLSSARLIPKFNVGEMTGGATSKILSAVNPDFKKLDQEGLTVDQFILETQKSEEPMEAPQGLGGAMTERLAVEQERLLLQEGRKKFSEIAGKPLTGQEKISDVFSGIINQRIDQYLGGRMSDSGGKSPLPFILAVALFLTVFPLGSLLSTVWIIVVGIIIWIFKKTDLIRIAKVPVEMEVIEQ